MLCTILMSIFPVCIPRNSSQERDRERYLKHRRNIMQSQLIPLMFTYRDIVYAVLYDCDTLHSTSMK